MAKKIKTKKKQIPTIQTKEGIYKKLEFEAFLDLLRGESSHHWTQIAKTLGVDQGTITAWKKIPQAQKAIHDGIKKALDGMAKAGKEDWRMWESKLKMLGLSPIEKSSVALGSETLRILMTSYQPKKMVTNVNLI